MVDNRVRVVIIDDHEFFRGGLAQLLAERGIDVVGESGLPADGIRQVGELAPDVALMDLSMPGMSGIAATQRLSASAPLVRVLVLTVSADEQSVTDALLAGACGYLLKDSPIEHIVEGIRAAARGESSISPRIASQLVRRMREPHPVGAELTPRELEVLQLLSQGVDNPGIARTLHLSQHTVKSHVSSILVKLQVENRIQAAVRAVRGRLV